MFEEDRLEASEHTDLFLRFFKVRGNMGEFIAKPQTAHTRKMFGTISRSAADKRSIFWMWNPKNYGSYFKSKIIYERYPESQDEVDEIIERLRLPIRVIYDPEQ